MNSKNKRFPCFLLALVLAMSMMVIQAPSALAADTAVEVSDFDEFNLAIFYAEDGDTVIINGLVEIPASYGGIGWDGKHLTLQRGNQDGYIRVIPSPSGESLTINNFTFDGAEINGDETFLTVQRDTIITNCTFVDGVSGRCGAIYLAEGSLDVSDSTFSNNSGGSGGHVSTSVDCSMSFTDCTFTDGKAIIWGGAVLVNAGVDCLIDGCTMTKNQAQMGGAIATFGSVTIVDSLIYGNTATLENNGNDIWSDSPGQVTFLDSTEALVSLFDGVGMTWEGWYHDSPTEDDAEPISIPDTLTGMLCLTAKASVTPDPEPEPDPDEDNTPPAPPSRPSGNGSSNNGSNTTKEEEKPTGEAQEAPVVLVCGEAVLDTTKTAYLMGYADGLLGESDTLTRGQAAQVLFRLLTDDSLDAVHTLENSFPDVTESAWYNEAVSTIAKAGVIVGSSDGLFHAENTITWAEMVTMIARFVEPCSDRSIITRHWARDYLNTAISYDWIDYKDTFDPDAAVTRGEFVSFINTVFTWANNQIAA